MKFSPFYRVEIILENGIIHKILHEDSTKAILDATNAINEENVIEVNIRCQRPIIE